MSELFLRGEEQRWFDGAAIGRLLFQRCADCGSVPDYFRTVCPVCWSEALEDQVSAGQGEIYSFTTQHRAGAPGFEAEVPYTLVLVDLDEGFRILADLRDCPDDLVAVGLRVTVSFEPRGPFAGPGFRPLPGGLE